jgi:Flp pilus assembly protein TadD
MNGRQIWWLIMLMAVVAVTGCKTPPAGSKTSVRAESAIEEQLQKIIDAGEAANTEVEQWLAEAAEKNIAEGSEAAKELNQKIEQRYAVARKGYADFIKEHPKHGGGYAAYGDFLLGQHDEDGAELQLKKALELDQSNPTVYNDLANIYGHHGGVKESFNYYAKAIKLDPTEPIYFQNFGTTVFLFRKDAKEYYNIDEQQVFDKALMLYSNAMRLDPTNFALASDVASSYYGIKPWRFEEALRSWTNALTLTRTDFEREQVYTHFARIETQAGRYDEARASLTAVTNEAHLKLKDRMLRNIVERQQAAATNRPAGNP